MLGVTQFEVYALAKGRWTLHARYAGHDQNEAMWDARTTEASTGFPTKIVRETFFPEINDSERITTYISPNAKKAVKGQPVGTAPQQRPAPQARARQAAQPRRLTAAQMMLRIVVAAAFSVLAAAVMVGVIKYVLSTFAEIGIAISPAASSMIMTYSWVVMFLLFFFSLFRSRLPLHRILADMWHASAKPAAAVAAKVKPVKMKLKPKHDRGPTSPESLREWQDLRMRRGDPDIFAAPTDMAPNLPQVDSQGFEIFKPAEVKPAAEKAPQEKKLAEKTPEKIGEKPAEKAPAAKPAPEKAAQEKAAQDKAAEEKAIQERIAKAKEKAAHEKAAAEKAAREQTPLAEGTAAVAPPPVLEDENDFAHAALGRFIADVVKPAAAAAMRDDPVARRGMALVITGAVDGIKARPEAIALDTRALLAWGLLRTGMNETVADLFLQSHEAYVSQPANQSLVATGQGLITDMIPLQSPEPGPFVDALSAAFAAWRTPFGQPGWLVDGPEGLAETPFARSGGLVDAFLLTELRPLARHDDPLVDDARMAEHNGHVRAALAEGGGVEVKHTGKGIFARFTDPAAALACAKALQRDLGAGIALALIGNADSGEDPVLSPTLFLRAEAAMGSTSDGQASVEAHVIGQDQRIGQPTDLVILAPPPPTAGEVPPPAAGEVMVA